MQFETHRNCITNDLFSTLLLLDAHPRNAPQRRPLALRGRPRDDAADHAPSIRPMSPACSNAPIPSRAASPIAARCNCRCISRSIASGSTRSCDWWRRGFALVARRAPGRATTASSSASSARATTPSPTSNGEELSDRWSEALVLKRWAQEDWAERARCSGAAGEGGPAQRADEGQRAGRRSALSPSDFSRSGRRATSPRFTDVRHQPPPRTPRRMAAARRTRGLLSPARALQDDRPHLHAFDRARAGRARAVPHQSLRLPLGGDHRLVAGEDRRRRQQGRRQPASREPGRLHHPQRGPHGPARRRLRDPHPHARRHGGVGLQGRAAADQPDRAAILRPPRHPRLRGDRARPRRAPAHHRATSAPTSAA